MTTNQNDKVPMLDEQLDAAVGGAIAIPAFLRMHQGAMNSFSLNFEEIKVTLRHTACPRNFR